jgi:hypothetical protein
MTPEQVWKKPMDGWSKDEWAAKAAIWAEEDEKIFRTIRLATCPDFALMVEGEEEA